MDPLARSFTGGSDASRTVEDDSPRRAKALRIGLRWRTTVESRARTFGHASSTPVGC